MEYQRLFCLQLIIIEFVKFRLLGLIKDIFFNKRISMVSTILIFKQLLLR